MKFLLALLFTFCFYSFFYYIRVGYEFLKATNSLFEIGAKSTLNSQKSPENFIFRINVLLYSSFFLIIFSGWLVFKLFPWWVIIITVLLGNFFANMGNVEHALFEERLTGARRTFFAGLIAVVLVFIIWLFSKS